MTTAPRAHSPPLAEAAFLPRILIADADWSTASALRSALVGAAVSKILPTLRRAQLEIAEIERYAALVIDPTLPDGSGVELARLARERSPSIALVIHSERFDAELLSQAFELGARWMPKPFAVRHRKALVTIVQQHHPVSDVVLAHSQLLTKKQQGILELLAAGIERSRICELQQISMATLKWHVRQILRKTGRERLSEVVLSVRVQSAMLARAPAVYAVQRKNYP